MKTNVMVIITKGMGIHRPLNLGNKWKWITGFENRLLNQFPVKYIRHYVISRHRTGLTRWGRDKIDAILQTTFSNAISWKKMFEFRLKFHWSLFLKVQLAVFSIGSDNGLALNRRHAIISTNDDPVQWRIYTSLGLNELKNHTHNSFQTP